MNWLRSTLVDALSSSSEVGNVVGILICFVE